MSRELNNRVKYAVCYFANNILTINKPGQVGVSIRCQLRMILCFAKRSSEKLLAVLEKLALNSSRAVPSQSKKYREERF